LKISAKLRGNDERRLVFTTGIYGDNLFDFWGHKPGKKDEIAPLK
jgi:hypothetical protein